MPFIIWYCSIDLRIKFHFAFNISASLKMYRKVNNFQFLRINPISIWILFAYYLHIENKYFYFFFIFAMERFDKFWDFFIFLSQKLSITNTIKKMFSWVYRTTIFSMTTTNNLCCPCVWCDKYHVLPNKQQIRITNLRIKAYIDEKFTIRTVMQR